MATVTIHPPRVVPDQNQYQATTIEIPPARHRKIGIEAMITNVTEGFASLDPADQHCRLNQERPVPYSDINCRMQTNIDLAIKECQCVPWFHKTPQIPEKICTTNSMICFDEMMFNLSIKARSEQCIQACIYSSYDLNHLDLNPEIREAVYSKMRSGRGQAWLDFLSEKNKAMTVYEGVIDKAPHGRQAIRQVGFVEVNFDHQLATVTLKDAKVTFPDKVGNIGGTFGVFLGLSFVGILDVLILVCQWVKSANDRKKLF